MSGATGRLDRPRGRPGELPRDRPGALPRGLPRDRTGGGPAGAGARQRFIRDTARWITDRFAPGAVLTADTALFEGLIDSIRILELIAWTERALDRRIPDRMIRMDHFRTLGAIAETFIPEDGLEEARHVDR